MIVGIGADIVEVARFGKLLERYGERIVRRLLSESEMESYRESVAPEMFLASRFAAKEAFAKALGIGVRAPALLTNISVLRGTLGQPELKLADELQAFTAERGVTTLHVSLSHERSMACAFVVLEGGAR